MENINSLIRENIKNLLPYSSARDEYKGSKVCFWMPMKIRLET